MSTIEEMRRALNASGFENDPDNASGHILCMTKTYQHEHKVTCWSHSGEAFRLRLEEPDEYEPRSIRLPEVDTPKQLTEVLHTVEQFLDSSMWE